MLAKVKQGIIKPFKALFNAFRIHCVRKYAIKAEGKNIPLLNCVALTTQEKKSLKQQWGRLGLKIYEDFYRVYKTIEEFNPKYVSDDLYYPVILRALNPIEYSIAYSHKALYDNLFKGVRQPRTICKRIKGTLFDDKMNIISQEEALNVLRNNIPFIIKPSVDTSMGKNIIKIKDVDIINESLLERMGDDFIAQDIVNQSDVTAALNSTSLNTFRISTLFINGQFSVCNIVMRMGQGGAIVDNLGAGGLMLGVRFDGTLFEYAYDNKYNKHYKNGEFVFAGKRIEHIDKIITFVKDLHTKYIPNMGFVGWDIALDNEEFPVLIEVNLKWPTIHIVQLANATPMFGERTDEVVNFVIKHRKCN